MPKMCAVRLSDSIVFFSFYQATNGIYSVRMRIYHGYTLTTHDEGNKMKTAKIYIGAGLMISACLMPILGLFAPSLENAVGIILCGLPLGMLGAEIADLI